MPFSTLGLIPELLHAIADQGYTAPTPVQTAAIPAILRGADVLAAAQTGSGKTAAFALPLLQRLMLGSLPRQRQRQARALVLAPTRELALQAGAVFEDLARHAAHPLKVTVLFGGVSINPQMMALRGGADIVVATPGRLLDLVERNALTLDAVGILVLDEADRLLDMGFSEEIARVLALLPAQRQNLFFSATFPPAVRALAAGMLAAPVEIDVAVAGHDLAAPDIVQRVIEVDAGRRTALLRHLIATHAWHRLLVFVATKHTADIVALKLQRGGIAAAAFHGDLSQGARTQLLAEFRNTRLQVLVATDVAARGIDIAQLPAVLNYDLPRSTVDYTHRIGRTGRAGESGVAISFISAATAAHFSLIEERQNQSGGKSALQRERIAGFEPVEKIAAVQNMTGLSEAALSNGGIKGQRKSKKDKLREAAARLASTGTVDKPGS